jgi:hypothetical protein
VSNESLSDRLIEARAVPTIKSSATSEAVRLYKLTKSVQRSNGSAAYFFSLSREAEY